MPRSKDPRNYGPFYAKLAELMDRGEPDIKLTFPGKQAVYHRNNFFAYVNAWSHEIKRLQSAKHLTDEQRTIQLDHALRMDDILRQYLALIEDGDEPDTKVLRFVLRGLDIRQTTGIEQLDTMLANSTGHTYEEVQAKLRSAPIPVSSHQHLEALRAEESPVSHFFEGVEIVPIPGLDVNAELEAMDNPPDPEDMTDLIIPSNQATEPSPMEQVFQAADKNRTTEKELTKPSKKST